MCYGIPGKTYTVSGKCFWPGILALCIIFGFHRLYSQILKTMETNLLLRKVNWLLVASALVMIATIAMGSALFVSCEPAGSAEPLATEYTRDELIARGKYLVNTSACHDCHTPKIMTPHGPELDTTRLLSGYPSSAPRPKVYKDALNDWLLFGH